MNRVVLAPWYCLSVLCLLAVSLPVFSATVDSVVSMELSRIKQAESSQKRIDAIYQRAEKASSAYQIEAKVVKGLVAYNTRLDKTVVAQKEAINELRQSLANVGEIERQVLPLMLRMLDSMDQFVALDMPFLQTQRVASHDKIKDYMSNSKVPVSERFRLVFDLYSREIGYGKTIESYSDSISFDGTTLDVDVLRVGRLGLYFQTKDNIFSGVWNKTSSRWERLPNQYGKPIRQAIRIAQQKQSPDLLRGLPLLIYKDDQ